MRISDWSSDVCSSDLTSSNDRKRPDFSDVLVKFLLRPCRALRPGVFLEIALRKEEAGAQRLAPRRILDDALLDVVEADPFHPGRGAVQIAGFLAVELDEGGAIIERFLLGFHLAQQRSEEHTSELQSLMRISYAVFCLKKKKK